jgi:hypothetical protein
MEKIENDRLIKSASAKLGMNFVLFIVFLYLIFTNISAGYDEYKIKKETLLTEITNYENVQKNGLDFKEFSQSVTDPVLKPIISKIKYVFDDHFINKTTKPYSDLIKEKSRYVAENKKSDVSKKRDEQIAKIIPLYQE